MPEIAPFRGVVFDPSRVDLRQVLAPLPGAAEASAKAAAGWLQSGLVVRDPYKAIYRYVQHALVPGTARTVVRRGVVAAVRMTGTGDARVRSPERVVPAIVEERAALLERTRFHGGLSFGVYTDGAGEVERALRPTESRPPAIDVTIGDVRHVLWRVQDAEVFGKVRRGLVAKRTVLFDGHHRYAAANLLRERLDRGPGLSPQASPQFTPMFLCNGSDEGLIVRGAHRLLSGVAGFDAKGFLARARAYFVTDVVPGGARDAGASLRALDEAPGHQPAIVVAFPGEADSWRLTLDAHVNPQALGVAAHPLVAKLPPSLLHGMIFERILGLAPAAHEGGTQVRHSNDAAAALAALGAGGAVGAVGAGGVQAAFLLPPLTPELLRNIAELDDGLPPRSAWIYPPLLPGIVMATIDPDEDLL